MHRCWVCHTQVCVIELCKKYFQAIYLKLLVTYNSCPLHVVLPLDQKKRRLSNQVHGNTDSQNGKPYPEIPNFLRGTNLSWPGTSICSGLLWSSFTFHHPNVAKLAVQLQRFELRPPSSWPQAQACCSYVFLITPPYRAPMDPHQQKRLGMIGFNPLSNRPYKDFNVPGHKQRFYPSYSGKPNSLLTSNKEATKARWPRGKYEHMSKLCIPRTKLLSSHTQSTSDDR